MHDLRPAAPRVDGRVLDPASGRDAAAFIAAFLNLCAPAAILVSIPQGIFEWPMYWLFYATSALLFFITLTTVVLMSFSRWRPWATVSIAVWSGLTFLLALLADIRGAAELEPDDYLSASFSLLAMGSYVVLGIVIAVGTTILLWRATARPSPAARQTLTTS